MKIVTFGLSTVLIGMVGAYAFAQRANVAPPPREVHFTNDPRYRWGELHIAINPRNPNNIAIATVGVGMTQACQQSSTDCQTVPSKMDPPVPGYQGGSRMRGFYENPDFTAVVVFYSFDRGRTWGRVRVPRHPRGFPTLDDQGDPSITAGPDGSFYASWDANDWGTPEHTLPRAGVAVSKSRDGGRTWSAPVLSGTPVDGPKLTADLNTGMIYVSSSTFLGPRSTGNPKLPMGTVNTRWLASSHDGVRWTPPRPMGGAPSNMSAAHGMLAVAFRAAVQGSGPFGSPNAELCGKTPPPCTIFQTTTNGGTTWTRHLVPVPSDQSASLVAANPATRGHFALALLRNSGGEYHVYQTRDSGRTWTGPAIVTDDASKAHFHGGTAFSREGVLGMIWRTRLGARPTQPPQPGQPQVPSSYNVWGAISRDGGATFSAPVKISTADSPAPPPTNTSGDDYSGIAIDGQYLYAGWADWRSQPERGNFFAAVPLTEFRPRAR